MKDWRKLESPSQLYVKNPLHFPISLTLSLSRVLFLVQLLSASFTCFDAAAYTRVSRYIPLLWPYDDDDDDAAAV